MMDTTSERSRDRVPTGIRGLDAILQGGFLRQGVYMLQGKPGAGKTILANQFCFHHAKQGGRVLYTTLLAETHERMLFNLEPLSFVEPSLIPDQLTYVSAFTTLEEHGLKGLVELLRREGRLRRATLLIIDGLVAVEELADTKKDFKKFIHDLQVHANLLGCTILLLTSSGTDPVGPEHTMVDGVLELSTYDGARHSERSLEVKKFRGSNALRGEHSFHITRDGIAVYPRLEALLRDPSPDDASTAERVSTGMPRLDDVLHGGLRRASSTVVFGPTGVGKTTMGLHFLNASSESEPGLLYGFYETPPRILLKGAALGLPLQEKQQAGYLDIEWQASTERVLDALGDRLLSRVRERGIKRVFIDGIDGFLKAAERPERLSHYLSALTNELRVSGVTALYTSELPDLFSTQVALPLQGVSSLVENIFLLRFVEQDAQLSRVFSVVKTRDSDYDRTLREYRITSAGADIDAPLPSLTSRQSAGGDSGTSASANALQKKGGSKKAAAKKAGRKKSSSQEASKRKRPPATRGR